MMSSSFGSKWACGALVVALVAGSSHAESDKAGVSIDELRVPSSPAFVMLGVSPTAVERPSTPRALALSLLSATERADSGLPKDIALEFAPYWWRSHPKLTVEHYYDKHKGVGETIAQTFALSLGTTDLQDRAGIDGTRAALGVRFMLRQGSAGPKLGSRIEELRAAQLSLLECVPDEPEEPIDEACASEREKDVRRARQGVIEAAERIGWTVEVGAAVTRDFPENDANAAANSRSGIWLTASYHREGPFSVVGVLRYLGKDDTSDQGGAKDLGARVIWKNEGEAGLPPLAISIEYLRRLAERGDDASRLVAVLEYRLPFENLSVVASYGKDFADLTGHEPLVSTLGVNVGLGREPLTKAAGP